LPRSFHSAKGFMLIELLVVIGLILILYVMYLSPSSRPYQRRQQATCRRNLQFVYIALQTYATDSKTFYPAIKGAKTSEEPLSLLVPRYTTATENFICPGAGHRKLPAGQPFQKRKISYAYVMGLTSEAPTDQWIMSDTQASSGSNQGTDILFSPDGKSAGRNHREFGGNLLFCDGRAEFSPAKTLRRLTIPGKAVALNPKP
ncbi:MAG: type II secretion system protein, partial [Verrucomicrobiota bacterium]